MNKAGENFLKRESPALMFLKTFLICLFIVKLLTTFDNGDGAILIFKGSSIAVIWEEKFTYIFKPCIDVNLKLRAVHLKFRSIGAVRTFASTFFSEQVVSYGSDEYSIAYFKISPPGIDKIDFSYN